MHPFLLKTATNKNENHKFISFKYSVLFSVYVRYIVAIYLSDLRHSLIKIGKIFAICYVADDKIPLKSKLKEAKFAI